MYILLRSYYVSGYGEMCKIVAKSESLDSISDDIKKRVKEGCATETLTVVKEIDFNLDFKVDYKEAN